MAESTVTSAEVQPEGEKKKKKFKWRVFVGHILRAVLWILFIVDRRGLLDSVFPTLARIYAYRWSAFVAVPVVYVAIRTVTQKEFLKAIGEVLVFYVRYFIFPLTILIQFVKLPLWFFKQLSKLIKLPRRTEIQLTALILAVITVRVVAVTHQLWLLYCCMVLLGLCLLVLWTSILDWTTNPFHSFGRVATIIDKIWSRMKTKLIGEQGGRSSDQKTKKSSLQLLWGCGKFFVIVEKWLSKWLNKRFLKTQLLTWFLTFYLVALTLTIFGFAVEYNVLRRIDPSSFGGAMETFSDSLYYTALTSFTMSFGETAPTIALAKVLTLINIAVMMFFFVVLILIFATVTEEAARDHLTTLRDEFLKKVEDTKMLSEEIFHVDGNLFLQADNFSQLPDLPPES